MLFFIYDIYAISYPCVNKNDACVLHYVITKNKRGILTRGKYFFRENNTIIALLSNSVTNIYNWNALNNLKEGVTMNLKDKMK